MLQVVLMKEMLASESRGIIDIFCRISFSFFVVFGADS